MEKIAFKMQLKPGTVDAYRKAHDLIWPELVDLLTEAGISDYSIHHDPKSDALFAVLWRTDDHRMDTLPDSAVMRRWWEEMSNFLVVEENGQPATEPLDTVFHLNPGNRVHK